LKHLPDQAFVQRDTITEYDFSDSWYRSYAKWIFILVPSKIPSGKLCGLFSMEI